MQPADGAALSLSQRGALGAIRAYKLLFSQYFVGSCRYVPSCSQYAGEAIAVYGVIRGSWLAMRRLARCHPLGASGHDPVPRPTRRVTPQL